MSADHPAFRDYGGPTCAGCHRKLVKTEQAFWFAGYPRKAVYGLCCWHAAAVESAA